MSELATQDSQFNARHIGRSWSGSFLEDKCPCPKQPCGLVRVDEVSPECEQHASYKTIRQTHDHDACPARVRSEAEAR